MILDKIAYFYPSLLEVNMISKLKKGKCKPLEIHVNENDYIKHLSDNECNTDIGKRNNRN